VGEERGVEEGGGEEREGKEMDGCPLTRSPSLMNTYLNTRFLLLPNIISFCKFQFQLILDLQLHTHTPYRQETR
jgi:hypothetical protein